MKNKLSLIKNIVCFSMAFFLPIHIGISNVFLVLFFVVSTYLVITEKRFHSIKIRALYFSLIPIVLLYIFGLFFSFPIFKGIDIIGRNISFLLCPLIFSWFNNQELTKIRKSLYGGLILGSILSIIILLINNFLNYFATRPFLKFDDEIFNYYYTYNYFTSSLEIHPTYLGVYFVIALVILIRDFFGRGQINYYLKIIGIVILSAGILFLNSRMVYFLFSVAVIGAILYSAILFFRKRYYKQLLILTIVSVCGIFLSFNLISKTFIVSRFTDELAWELSDQVDTSYNNKNVVADSRIARWATVLKTISEKPIFGHGTHSEKDILAAGYKKDGLLISYKNRYDAHNIYMSFAVEFGIVGLFILLFYLLSNLWIAIKAKDLEYAFLIFAIISVGCFESYLKNNAAITFVAMFGSMLLFYNLDKNSKNKVRCKLKK
ncbi:O-antigen ligase family protein [Aequorivita lipolytica]|uniref:O-antigen ligase family protein n=1 Tax=Aequorivita lipolytica TaxID=153267 RepID=A0A5C6YTE6_9FLAO|nr:O-antigen ligase family protein [Aequorivita lipolytica]TXD70285.1 O-antigen ligase family protein [Aequorivita lipolytica]SRX50712.1 hypothetical protein AEQU2_01188 [Aequorivita lipolytica]